MTTQYIYDLVDTWNASGTTFTAIKMDVTDTASASASLLMDLQVGSSSKFSVGKSGNVKASNGTAAIPAYGMGTIGLYTRASVRLNFAIGGSDVGIELGPNILALQNTGEINWTAATLPSSAADLFLTRRAAANLRLGIVDVAAPVAQTLSVQSVVAGTTNTAGANLTITGSQGTGTGAGGSIIFQVAPLGSSGSAQNALATALTIANDKTATLEGTTFTVVGGNLVLGSSAMKLVGFSSGAYIDSGNSMFHLRNYAGSTEVVLVVDAANTLALRNGGTSASPVPQSFRVYNWTDGTNGEYLSVQFTSNTARIGTNGVGTGVSRELLLGVGGGSQWGLNTAGHFITYGSDNVYDIGASGANRPRTVYAGTDIHLGQYIRQATNLLYIVNGAGILQLSNASNSDFGRLQFGGTSALFPALKRNGAGIDVVGADGTNVSFVRVPGVAVASLPSASTAGVGARSFVTDANATTYASPVAGGGANKVPVFSDGTNWIIG